MYDRAIGYYLYLNNRMSKEDWNEHEQKLSSNPEERFEPSYEDYGHSSQERYGTKSSSSSAGTEALNAAVAAAVAAGEGNMSLATVNDRNMLSELDYLLCRNVEVFRASEEDVRDSSYVEGGCGTAAVVGQVGLRCMHCSSSPLATAGYATVFPASIVHIGASLRMMADWHFSRCNMTPGNIRERIDRSLVAIHKAKEEGREEEDESMRSLKDFCVSVMAKRLNFQNLVPAKTGIIFAKSARDERPVERPRESPQQSAFRQSDPRWFGQEEYSSSSASYHHPQQFPSPRQHATSPTQHRPPPPPLPMSRHSMDMMSYGGPIPQPPQAPHPSMDRRMMYQPPSFAPSRLDYSHSFFRESMGWSCRHCHSVPFQFRAPNSFYPHHTPPSPSFIEYHLQLCSGTIFYQPPPAQYNYPDPNAASSRDAYALDYLASVSSYDSPLVLDEDRVLLSDYFFYLIKQLQFCRFAESDRKTRGGKRENVKVGFGGLECRHCAIANPSSSRKFFWSNVDRLANSFAEIPSHLLKCKNCPDRIKNSLHVLKAKHPEQMAKLPRGSQKVFFRRMWRRVHIDSSTEKEEEEAQGESSTSATISKSQPKSAISKISLAIPEDKDWLSDTDCFVRRNLEVFCASNDDIFSAQTDRKFPITLGQVGIRCIHCAATSEGARGNAVNFPYSIDGIYEVVRELQKLHLESCVNLPAETSQEMANLKTSTSLSSVLRRYYVLAAKALGMIDTPEGIRMSGETLSIGSTGDLNLNTQDQSATQSTVSMKEANEDKSESSRKRKSSPSPEDDTSSKKRNTS